MQRAEFGKGGDLVTLRKFMDLAGSDDPKKWVVKPYCPECGEQVHAYDKRGARGFWATRDEVTKRRTPPGFSHYAVDPADTKSPVLLCPNSFRDDPRYTTPNLREFLDHNT
ncbi:MAG: hypothetical protein M3N08_01370, partial [Pseudomonadota bacterium]|nr:hypothetical protein [Pseudomonadota bacterium]